MLQVFLKELLEISRDRRALLFMVLLPTLVMPILMGGFGYLAGRIVEEDKAEVLRYALVGAENDPALAARIAADKQFRLVDLPAGMTYRDAVAQERVRFVLEVPATAAAERAAGLPTQVRMYLNDASTTNSAYDRLQTIVSALAVEMRDARLSAAGLHGQRLAGVLEPLAISKVSTATPRETVGERLGSLVPYLLIIVCLSGVMYPAVDLGVGEKERGTLETLLLCPVPRHSIVLAKFGVLFTTGFVSVFLTIASSAVWTLLVLPAMATDTGSAEMLQMLQSISLFDLSLIVLMLVPVTAIFAAVVLSLSIYARGYKEAQSYMSPMMILAFMPLILAMLPGVKLTWGWAAMPVTNVSLAIKEICKGTIEYPKMLAIFGSGALIAAACIMLCTWWFQRESVLFRSA
jgi:sodium transport system permease protein